MYLETLHTDKALLDRVAADDEEAFNLLFLRYKDRIYSVALRMTRSAYLAEETVQEVFVKLWTLRASLGTVEKPSQYIYASVYNSLYTRFRKTATEHRMLSLMTRTDEADHALELQLLQKENRELLERALQRLTPQQRQAYTLSKLEGLSRAEVAERMALSPNTVRNHLQEAVKALRATLDRSFPLLIAILLHR